MNTSDVGNGTVSAPPATLNVFTGVTVTVFGLICVVGLVGNGLVIFVILRYTKMKTVTNMYILNLSVADALFLLGLPLIMTTSVLKQWIFGAVMCKIYFILTCINMFTGTCTLMVMSGDRFLAVCFPITSMSYRTSFYASFAIAGTWIFSILLMIPIIFYVNLKENMMTGAYSCVIEFPKEIPFLSNNGFTLYQLVLGFVVPVVVISVLYTLLLIKLRLTGPQIQSVERRRSHRKVTKLVTLIVIVFVVCWLPYWTFQVHLITRDPTSRLASYMVYLFTGFTILSYSNSMVNPCLYAFTNENFRESFINAFRCAGDVHLGARRPSEMTSHIGNNNCSNAAKSKKLKEVNRTQYEFTTLPNSDANSKTVDT